MYFCLIKSDRLQSVILLLSLGLLAFPAIAKGTNNHYADELVSKADSLKLAWHPYWLSLVHYKPASFGRSYQSQADDAVFFNDPQGKYSPDKELQATLRAFFNETGGDKHPQCRFPARYHWLKQQLAIDPSKLSEVPCEELRSWQKTINGEHVTLVFPAAYLNSPSSMFGHTLLRVTPADYRKDTPLAAYALNYAANADVNENGISYAYKGLFGGYPGMFSIVPYYEKINQYSDLENRDIWEYPLNLTQDEVDQMLRHAWEVRKINFDYYFLTENCSYHVLSLLEVARPGINLTDNFSVKAIPSDTVRAAIDAGLTAEPDYRPSTTTVINQHLLQLEPDQQQLVYELATADVSPAIFDDQQLDTKTKSQILELSYDYARYRALKNASLRDQRATQNYSLLETRSHLPAGDVWLPVTRPEFLPEQGHKTTRFALGAGRRDGSSYTTLRFRPAYHDILDPLPGYSRGSQINFLDFRGRYFFDDSSIKLDKFTVINILSLTPRDEFFKPISWSIDTGFERMWTNDGETNGAQINGGGGLTYRIPGEHYAYIMMQGQLKVAGRFQDNYSLGAGAKSGLLFFFKQSTADLSLSGLRYELGETDNYFSASWQQSFPIGRQSLRYRLEHRFERGHTHNVAEVLLNWYF